MQPEALTTRPGFAPEMHSKFRLQIGQLPNSAPNVALQCPFVPLDISSQLICVYIITGRYQEGFKRDFVDGRKRLKLGNSQRATTRLHPPHGRLMDGKPRAAELFGGLCL